MQAVNSRLSGGLRHFQPYEAQKQFFNLGSKFKSRVLSGGNRVGKTYTGAHEVGYHVSGEYPEWWDGHRFDEANNWWAGSTDWATNVEGVQKALVGDIGAGKLGEAFIHPRTKEVVNCAIPKDRIHKIIRYPGVANALAEIQVKHVSGGISRIRMISYAKGREKLQAGGVVGVLLDEEPEMDVFTELTLRVFEQGGLVLLTFTPLKGISSVLQQFIGDVTINDKFPRILESKAGALIRIPMTEVPHITPKMIEELRAKIPTHEHMARIDGIPALGEGAIFPFSDQELTVPQFTAVQAVPGMPPLHYRVIDAIDFGWTHPTARVRMVMDPDSKHIYVCKVYKQPGKEPQMHVANWIEQFPGAVPVVWPHDGRNTEGDGETKASRYRKLGVPLTVSPAELPTGGNSVDGGIQLMYEWMASGLFHVVAGNQLWFQEKNLYRTEKKPSGVVEIVKELDDIMDATRYGFMALLCGWGKEVRHAFTQSAVYDFRTGRSLERDPDEYDFDPNSV